MDTYISASIENVFHRNGETNEVNVEPPNSLEISDTFASEDFQFILEQKRRNEFPAHFPNESVKVLENI